MGIKNQLNLSDLNQLLCQCDHCSSFFHAKRFNKYCSNTCRQMAYYIRNGLRRDTRKNFPGSGTDRILDTYESKINAIMSHSDEEGNTIKSDVQSENLEKQIKKLEQLLAHSTLRTVALEEMISLAEEYFSIPITKKSGAKQ